MRVFSVPSSVPFLRTVVAALIDGRLVEDFEARTQPERLTQATFYLPTRRVGAAGAGNLSGGTRAARPCCCRASWRLATSTKTNWLSPRTTIPVAAPRTLELPPRLGELERRLTLAKTGGGVGEELRVPRRWWSAGPASTLALAGDLARLMDDMVTRGVDWKALDGLVPDASINIGSSRFNSCKSRARPGRRTWPKSAGSSRRRGAIS